MKQLTKEQAVTFHDSKAWADLDYLERATFQLFQDRLCMPFSVFHESVEKALGRSVFSHELGLCREGLIEELKGNRQPPSFSEIIGLIPEEKLILVGVSDVCNPARS